MKADEVKIVFPLGVASPEESRKVLTDLAEKKITQLAEWILAYLAQKPTEPSLGFPRDYRSPGPFLVETAEKINKDPVATAFGEASCLALGKLFEKGGLVPGMEPMAKRIVGDLLYLIESFPCSSSAAQSVVDSLFVVIASNFYHALPGEDINIRERVLRAVASKIGFVKGYRPELGLLFDDDLLDRDTVLPAYSIILQTNPQHAVECFPLVLTTLRQNQMPSRGLMFEIARQLTSVPLLGDTLLWAVAKVGDEVACTDLLDHLEYLGLQGFKEQFLFYRQKIEIAKRQKS